MALPSGYTQLKYIRASGSQYINTGVTATANTTAKYKYSIDQILTYGPHVLSGQSWYFPMVRGNTTAGTFAGAVVAGASNQAPETSLLRNSKLVSSDTTPTVNGEIFWTYG